MHRAIRNAIVLHMRDIKSASINARATESTKAKLSALAEALGCSESEALAKAVEAMHRNAVGLEPGVPEPAPAVFVHDDAMQSVPRAVLQRYETLVGLVERDCGGPQDTLDPMVCATLLCAAAAAWDSAPLPGLFEWEQEDES